MVGKKCDSQCVVEMEVEYEMQVRSVLEPLLKIQEELLKEIEIREMSFEEQVAVIEVKNEERFGLGLNSLSNIQKELAGEMSYISRFPFKSSSYHSLLIIECDPNLHISDASGMIHHQLQPPDEAVDDTQEFLPTHGNHQIISFLAPEFESYEFDYGNLGRTCLWIDHGPDELPQLLIFPKVLLEFEICITKDYFPKFKDNFARLQTMTNALLLLHIPRNHVRSCIYLGLVSIVCSKFLFLLD